MKIYTKRGDDGTTSLSDGSRISKDHILLQAYGTVDELNAFLGLLISEENEPFLSKTQNFLFLIGGMLATPVQFWENYYKEAPIETFIEETEHEIDRLSEELMPLSGFILPQGNQSIAYAHICRTVCRRAERMIIGLTREDKRYAPIQKSLNRLSDFFFI